MYLEFDYAAVNDDNDDYDDHDDERQWWWWLGVETIFLYIKISIYKK